MAVDGFRGSQWLREEIIVALLIGTDEAGYGPSLGPLVITATAWQCAQREAHLYRLLEDVVTDSPKLSNSKDSGQRILVADSKIASRSGSIAALELSVLVLLKSLTGKIPSTLPALVRLVMPGVSEDFFHNHFWLKNQNVQIPIGPSDGRSGLISDLADRFLAACQRNKIELTKVRSMILLPPEFNAGVVACGNKANLLSDRTLRLISEMSGDGLADTLIECDKHGGRNYYLAMIAKSLTNRPVSVVAESSASSIYRWSEANREMEIRFTANNESQLPVALASMVSKYLREVFMVAWNDFWKAHIPGIKPTKGYPQDAKRFLAEIKQVAAAKSYFRNDFWRAC